MEETSKIWMNGELVDWADATVHVGSHGLHYGSGVFEGVRAYETPRGTAVFRLTEHFERLHNSAQLLFMELPYSVEELGGHLGSDRRERAAGVLSAPDRVLRLRHARRVALGNPVDVAIMSWPWGTYLGEEGLRNGIRAKISSWQRIGPNVIPHVAKATGVYLNSMLAVAEANRAGYEEAILLTQDGYIADGSGENIFVVKDGIIYTPDLSASILPGHHARHDHPDRAGSRLPVVEKNLIRTDLYLADEVFMCGTAAEVTPIREVDDHGRAARAGDARDPGVVSRHRARPRRAWAQWLEYAPAAKTTKA